MGNRSESNRIEIVEPTFQAAQQAAQGGDKVRIHGSRPAQAVLETSRAGVEMSDAGKKAFKKKTKDKDSYIGRYEVKYVIPKSLVPDIREYIRPFCEVDPYCKGDPPEYVITTLQLDSPGLSLHYAKLWDFVNRFKLRVRTYNPVGKFPVFMEIKAKYRTTVVKYRSRVPFDKWGKYLFGNVVDLNKNSQTILKQLQEEAKLNQA